MSRAIAFVQRLSDQLGSSSDFFFEEAPFSDFKFVATSLVGYLAILFFIKKYGNDKKPIKLPSLFYLHNIILCAVSLALLSLITPIIFEEWVAHGLYYSICDRSMGFNNSLNFLYYLNYLTKVDLDLLHYIYTRG